MGLENLWMKWLEISEAMGNIVGRAVLSIFYFVLFAVPGLYFTFVSDRVGKTFEESSYFVEERTEMSSLDESRLM
ncbi:MAG TPA: hypothetical protein VN455_10265 [Methanotrichaceae archaeon]|nr:hypothetical protein [Methanotrichaceae archaeon]